MPLSGQAWPVAAAWFLASWMVMMVPMMLPSLVPMLWRHTRSTGVATLVSAGYYLVWAIYGVAAFALGIGVTTVQRQWPAIVSLVPVATGVVVLIAGGVQLTGWKLRQLAHCWDALACGQARPPQRGPAWRQGLRLGVRCCLCCSGYMTVLLVTGMMRVGVMALVAAAITIERIAPAPRRVARAAGVVIILTGAVLLTSSG